MVKVALYCENIKEQPPMQLAQCFFVVFSNQLKALAGKSHSRHLKIFF